MIITILLSRLLLLNHEQGFVLSNRGSWCFVPAQIALYPGGFSSVTFQIESNLPRLISIWGAGPRLKSILLRLNSMSSRLNSIWGPAPQMELNSPRSKSFPTVLGSRGDSRKSPVAVLVLGSCFQGKLNSIPQGEFKSPGLNSTPRG